MGWIIKANNYIFDELKYDFKNYVIFSFIRNPYNRAISSYEFIKNKKFDDRIPDELKNMSFKDFFINYENTVNIFIYTHSIMTQYENIKNTYNDIKVNYLCDYKKVDEELIKILQKINITDPYKHNELILNNLKINCSKKKNITDYYCEESLEIINRIFKKDFDFFNFKIYNNVDELNKFLLEYNN